MLKKIHHKLSAMDRKKKSFIAIALTVVLVGVLLFSGIKGMTSEASAAAPVNVDTTSDSIASQYIVSNDYFTKYSGYDLKIIAANQTCDDCYTLTYTFKIDPKFFLGRIHGFKAIIDIKNKSVDTARFVRIA